MTYEKTYIQSDVASYKLARTNSPIGRQDYYGSQISCRSGIKAKMHGQIDDKIYSNKTYSKRFLKNKNFAANLNNNHFLRPFHPLFLIRS